MGLAMAGVCYDAFIDQGKFKERGKLPIVAMMAAYPSPMHILVLVKSKVRTIADLKGTKVSLGAFGSGTENMAKNLLKQLGSTYDDIKPAFLSFPETAMGLRDGVVEAGFMAVAIPASAVLDLGSTRPDPGHGPAHIGLLYRSGRIGCVGAVQSGIPGSGLTPVHYLSTVWPGEEVFSLMPIPSASFGSRLQGCRAVFFPVVRRSSHPRSPPVWHRRQR